MLHLNNTHERVYNSIIISEHFNATETSRNLLTFQHNKLLRSLRQFASKRIWRLELVSSEDIKMDGASFVIQNYFSTPAFCQSSLTYVSAWLVKKNKNHKSTFLMVLNFKNPALHTKSSTSKGIINAAKTALIKKTINSQRSHWWFHFKYYLGPNKLKIG